MPQVQRLFEGGTYLNIAPDKFTFLYFYSTVHFLSANFPMDWYLTDNKSRITREIHAVEKNTLFEHTFPDFKHFLPLKAFKIKAY